MFDDDFYYRYFNAEDAELLAAFQDGTKGTPRTFAAQIGTEREVMASRAGQLYTAYQTGQCAWTARTAAFKNRHGYPCPLTQSDFTEGGPLNGIPFCGECCDWHHPEEEHSG